MPKQSKSNSGVFTVKSTPKQFVKVKREFKIYQPDVERQLKHCIRIVQTISSIRHSFTNTKQNKLANDFENFAKTLIEFHHWRLKFHLKAVVSQVELEEANGYYFNDTSKPGVIEVEVKSPYFGRLIDALLDMDAFMQASSKLSLTGNYLAHDIQNLNGKVVGVLRDINSTMQSVKASLSKEFGLSSDPKMASEMIAKIEFNKVKERLDAFYAEQRGQFELVKKRAETGDTVLVDKRNQSVTMDSTNNKQSAQEDALDVAFASMD